MSIGINLRVTGHTSIGGRKYQEDFFSVAYQETENDHSLEYAFFGIYDGHGGAEAALYAKEHLMNTIVSQKLFWSDNDEDVLKAIREGYIQTHYSMWREQDKWPKTSSGLPSTAGTTASIAFIRQGKIYVGHVGDSGIVLGFQRDKEISGNEVGKWSATALTEDHKPEAYAEKMRIMSCGGKVVTKSGVPRVVWNRPRIGHKGPVRRSTPIDEIPFLAVARSLGDLWSYNSAVNEFIVSPNPDVSVIDIDPTKHRCLIFGTDGLWNVLSPKNATEIVHAAEMENIRIALEGGRDWKNPSKLLVNEALERWSRSNMKADNTSVVVIMLDPPGPPKRDVLRSMRTSIQHIDYENTCVQPLNTSITLYDHTTRELIDLSQVTCQEAPQIVQEHIQHQQYLDTAASTSYQDIIYTDSFAESYNTLLNTSLSNDHSYTNYNSVSPQQYAIHHTHQHQLNHTQHSHNLQSDAIAYINEGHDRCPHDIEETYSLTNLQTKSERLHSEMMEACTASPSTSRYNIHQENLGNIAIIENFHDYPLPHMPHHHHTVHGFETQYIHQSLQTPNQPTYRMERYDYHQPNREEPVACSYNNQQYTAHDLSDHSYQRNAVEYLYSDEEPHVCEPKDANESSEAANCCVESSEVLDETEVQAFAGVLEQRTYALTSSHDVNHCYDEGIQINEISSTNLHALSPTQQNNHSDSDGSASGDETKASSTSSALQVLSKSCNKDHSDKPKGKVKKTLNNIVKIVYETRSSQRSHRTRSQQENLSTRTSKNIRNKFGRFLTKNTSVKSFLSFKKIKKTETNEPANNNNSNSNNNNTNNKDLNVKPESCTVIQPREKKEGTERRVLRSADQTKLIEEKIVHRTRRTAYNNEALHCNVQTIQRRSAQPLSEITKRKLPKRKIVLRKLTSNVKRVRR